ncbi:ribonuclease P protein component [Candidatus Nomurabacteria bacterium]|nr:ribonuclease P protein component [Candidatus Nomurabacteria bacterium]
MLPKKNRASTKEVKKIFKEGRSVSSLSLSLKYIKNISEETRISFIAPKNIAKSAVKRNSLRRLGYSVLRKNIKDFPSGTVGIFIFKKYQDDASILNHEIQNLLHKIN